MKNVSFEQKKIKLSHIWHFVDNKTQIMQHVLPTEVQQISLLSKYIQQNCKGVFLTCLRICKHGMY